MQQSTGRPAPVGLPSSAPTDSFWLQEPNDFLRGHRTTPELPKETDITIIGSGITGTSIAHFLLESPEAKDLSVTLLEAREACSGATGRNGGHCQPSFTSRVPGVTPFEIKNYDTLETYVASNNIPCEWQSKAGCHAFFKQELFEQASIRAKEAIKADPNLVHSIKIVTDPKELTELFVPTAVGAITITKAASLWPYKLITWMLERLVKDSGLNLQTNTPVQNVEQLDANNWEVHTSRGVLKSRHVVVATNAYTSAILPEMAGLIRQVRGQMSALLPSHPLPDTKHTYCFFGIRGLSLDMHDYLVQRPVTEDAKNGHFMYGGGRLVAEGNGENVSDDSTIDEGNALYLRETLEKVMTMTPLLGSTDSQITLKATHQWTGIMGYSRDDRPWVGPIPGKPGLWVAAGFTAHGMPCAHLVGQAVAQMLLATDRGDTQHVIEQRLVEGGFPACYLVSDDRISRNQAVEH